ncbi:hypothetical protein ABIA32_004607 [Streptacidiphilus sp. MAP12-20]|uniref:hypothetical protein n=1 Tax=Streptacidiphilus sp. MAP12-20 TaxID=3156299 RepID=UPI0035143BD8
MHGTGFRVLVGVGCFVALFALLGLWGWRQDRATARRVVELLASRPGWSWKQKAPEVRFRYQRAVLGHFSQPKFTWWMSGPLSGGRTAETVRVSSERSRGKGTEHRTSTIAVVVFPFSLPSMSLGPDQSRPVVWQTPVAPGQPDWAGVHGDSEDPEAAAALFTPGALDRVRSGHVQWRMEGCAVVLIQSRGLTPQGMLSLVDEAAGLVERLPAAVLARAVTQPNPWPGPTVGQPG